LVLGYYFASEPSKFQRLISRLKSAKTPAEEREAFALAARGGRIWELNRLRPEALPERASHITGDWVLELEWLESSPWTGEPYRAYRRVLDINSMESLYVHYESEPANQGAAANRRPAGQSGGSDNLSATVAADRAFPAAVAKLGSLGR
jgi:hypothetical protein